MASKPGRARRYCAIGAARTNLSYRVLPDGTSTPTVYGDGASVTYGGTAGKYVCTVKGAPRVVGIADAMGKGLLADGAALHHNIKNERNTSGSDLVIVSEYTVSGTATAITSLATNWYSVTLELEESSAR